MTEYQDAGLVTDDPVVAAMFLEKEVWGQYESNPEDSQKWIGGKLETISIFVPGFSVASRACDAILIPWPTVWEAIQPVEGEGYVYDAPDLSITAELTVFRKYNADPRMHGNDYSRVYFHKRVLNIVTTRTELRELVERCKGEEE